jgi:hypothetical protein
MTRCELVPCQVATFQQRGLAPSTSGRVHGGRGSGRHSGCWTVWAGNRPPGRPLVGRHLVFHAHLPSGSAGRRVVRRSAGCDRRRRGGSVGAEMLARTRSRPRARSDAGRRTRPAPRRQRRRSRRSPSSGPRTSPIPRPLHRCRTWSSPQPANQGLWADLTLRLPEFESSLPSITVPFGVIVGERSPSLPAPAPRVPSASWAWS